MSGSRALCACALLGACNQLAGIDEPAPDDGVPAIAGDYLSGADFRTNASLNAVVRFQTSVAYDRDARIAELLFQPLSASTHTAVGAPWSARVAVRPGQSVAYAGPTVAGDVPAEANPRGFRFAITGSIAGVFKDDTAFCGVITGSFATGDPAADMPLPSITFGALKHASASSPVQVNCNGDTVSP